MLHLRTADLGEGCAEVLLLCFACFGRGVYAVLGSRFRDHFDTDSDYKGAMAMYNLRHTRTVKLFASVRGGGTNKLSFCRCI